MAWPINPRPAKSLVTIQGQLNRLYPNRSKLSDGMLGDAAHQATISDHNPNSAGVVTAFDITHDPSNGLDIANLSEVLAKSRDPRIKYIIRNGQILIAPNWTWQPYSGPNPHTKHLHLSVGNDYDNARDWALGGSVDNITTKEIAELIQHVSRFAPAPDPGVTAYMVNRPIVDVLNDELKRGTIHSDLVDELNALRVEVKELKAREACTPDERVFLDSLKKLTK